MDIRIHKLSQPIRQKEAPWWPFAIGTAIYALIEVSLFDFVMREETNLSINFSEPPFWLESMGHVIVALLLPLGYPIAYVLDVYCGFGVYSANLIGATVNGIVLLLMIRKAVNFLKWRGAL